MKLGKIKINIMFLLVALAFIFSGFLREMLGAWASLLLHEFAHLGALKKAGLSYYQLELLPFGGVARIAELLSPEEEIRIALAGPLANIILLFVLYALKMGGFLEASWLDSMINLNFLMATVNLLPALPLDGGRIFRAWLAKSKGYDYSTWLVLRISQYMTIGAAIFSIFLFFIGSLHILSLFLAFFVLIKTQQEKEEMILLKLGDFLQRDRQLEKAALKGEIWSAPATLKLSEILLKINPRYFHFVAVLDEDMEIMGILAEKDLSKAFVKGTLTKTLGELL